MISLAHCIYSLPNLSVLVFLLLAPVSLLLPERVLLPYKGNTDSTIYFVKCNFVEILVIVAVYKKKYFYDIRNLYHIREVILE